MIMRGIRLVLLVAALAVTLFATVAAARKADDIKIVDISPSGAVNHNSDRKQPKQPLGAISRSLSRSLSPSASILARKKAFTRHPETNIPQLTDDQLELLADQIFDGIVTEVHHHDHHPHKDHKDPKQREWIDRYYRVTVLVTTVVHIRDQPMMTVSQSAHEIEQMESENEQHGGVRKHAHRIEEGELVDVLLWEAFRRPDYGAGQFMKGLEIGYVTIPKRPDADVEYRFFTQGLAHRMFLYREAYPTAGKELPAFEALLPNGVQVVRDDGTGDDTPIKQRKERTKSVRWDL